MEDGPPIDFCCVGSVKTDVEVNNEHSSPRLSLIQQRQAIQLSNASLSQRFFEQRQETHAM